MTYLEKLLEGVEVEWKELGDFTNYEQPTKYLVKSKNYNDKKTYIVGFYAYPVFCFTQKMPSPILNFTGEFMYNLEATPCDIHYLDVKINLTDDKEAKKYIPSDKEFGKRGYNYITKQNVEKLLDKITLLNPNDKKFSKIKLSILRSML